MISFPSVERIIVSELLKLGDPLEPYFFNQKYGFMPSTILAAVDSLMEKGLVEWWGSSVRLLEIDAISMAKLRDFALQRGFDFKAVPVWAKGPRRSQLDFFSPTLRVGREGKLTTRIKSVK